VADRGSVAIGGDSVPRSGAVNFVGWAPHDAQPKPKARVQGVSCGRGDGVKPSEQLSPLNLHLPWLEEGGLDLQFGSAVLWSEVTILWSEK